MSRPRPQRPCRECGKLEACRWLLVRVYEERDATDYRYFLCRMCRGMIHELLKGGAADWTQRSLFAVEPPAEGVYSAEVAAPIPWRDGASR